MAGASLFCERAQPRGDCGEGGGTLRRLSWEARAQIGRGPLLRASHLAVLARQVALGHALDGLAAVARRVQDGYEERVARHKRAVVQDARRDGAVRVELGEVVTRVLRVDEVDGARVLAVPQAVQREALGVERVGVRSGRRRRAHLGELVVEAARVAVARVADERPERPFEVLR